MPTYAVSLLVIVLCSSISAVEAAEPVPLPASGADVFTTAAGRPTVASKVYSSGKRIRTESNANDVSVATIMDLEKKRMWVMLTSGCREIGFMENPNRPQPWSGSDSKEELVGEETVDGHPCKKYKRTTAVGGKTYVHYVWFASDLKGFPIKSTDEAGKYETRLKNVVLGKQDAKLFEPPIDCPSQDAGSSESKQ